METVEKTRKKLDYKWIIMAVSFLMVFTGLGFCSGTKSLFFKKITDIHDLSRTLFSFNDSCRYITTAVLNLFFGELVMRLGAKKLIGCGFVCLIASCLVYSFAESIWMFCLGGVLLGMGLSWCTTTVVGYVVAKWFKEKRGTIMGIILASNGVGAAVAAQIVTPLIHEKRAVKLFDIFGTSFGYQDAYILIAAILVVVCAIVMIFFKEAPKGYVETGKPAAGHGKKPKRGATWEGIPYAEAVKKPYFYVALLCVFLTGISLHAVNGVAAPHLEDVGMDTSFIATAVSLHSLVLAFAKILAGISFDKFGLRVTLFVSHAIAAVSIFMLAMVNATSYTLAASYEILVSFALPLETILLPLIAADMFGERSYARMMGLMVSVNTAGYALGGPVANFVQETLGSYKVILVVFAVIMADILVVFQLVLRKSGKDRKIVIARLEAEKDARKAEKDARLQVEATK